MVFNSTIYDGKQFFNLLNKKQIENLIPEGYVYLRFDKAREGELYLSDLEGEQFSVSTAQSDWKTMQAIIIKKKSRVKNRCWCGALITEDGRCSEIVNIFSTPVW